MLKQYERQKMRGSEGFGFMAIGDTVEIERATKEADIRKLLKENNASEILFHHRYPTSTPNFIESAHPIEISGGTLAKKYYIVHNGVIRNDDTLKIKHEKLGFQYQTDIRKKWITRGSTYSVNYYNDSEVFGVEVALYLEGKQASIEAEGASAFIMLEVAGNKPKTLFFGRNAGNPLRVQRTKDFFSLSSEGYGVEVMPDRLYQYDYKTGKTTERDVEVGIYNIPKMGYLQNWSRDSHPAYCICAICKEDREDSLLYDAPIDQDDYYEAVSELDEIELEIKKAEVKGDYDTVIELEAERDMYTDIIKKYTRNYVLR